MKKPLLLFLIVSNTIFAQKKELVEIKSRDIAQLMMAQKYDEAKTNLKDYFATNPDKSSKEFQDLLILYVGLNKVIELEKKSKKDVPFAIIEEIPVFPGCKGTRKEKAACLNVNLRKHVGRYFNVEGVLCLKFELVELDEGKKEKICIKELPKGRVKMYATFRINKEGEVDKIKVKAPFDNLKKEVIKVINKLPKMKPGKQRGKNIGVQYTLPISFNVE
ncbi:MAG: energy transducer TonB [Tenacibaculum sp.]